MLEEDSEKNEDKLNGKVEIREVHFLGLGESCKATVVVGYKKLAEKKLRL